jgi:WD40 repeat protein
MCVTTHNDLNKKSTFNSEQFSTVHAHSAALSDIQFNPFVNDILATGAFEAQINLWKLSDGDHKVSINQSSSLNLVTESRCDSIQWNPNVENILISSSLSNLYLWDVEHNSVINCKSLIQTHRIKPHNLINSLNSDNKSTF